MPFVLGISDTTTCCACNMAALSAAAAPAAGGRLLASGGSRHRAALATAAVRTGLVWFKWGDLRIRDNEALLQAHAENDRVVHVFVFDPFWFKPVGPLALPRMGHHRARFLQQHIADLRAVRA
ncbi:MAG: hypothetical protein EOO56_18215, partial [Hymenobacter sp.]